MPSRPHPPLPPVAGDPPPGPDRGRGGARAACRAAFALGPAVPPAAGLNGADETVIDAVAAGRAATGGSLADAADWLALLVPPGFTPPAAALLVLAIGLAVWLAGGRYLRVALAAAGGIAGASLALGMLPPAGPTAGDWAPPVIAAVLGATIAAAARRFVATAGLALAFGLMAPAAVIAWDGMAAPHLTPGHAPGSSAERPSALAAGPEGSPAGTDDRPRERQRAESAVDADATATAAATPTATTASAATAGPHPVRGPVVLSRPEAALGGSATPLREAADRAAAAAVDAGIAAGVDAGRAQISRLAREAAAWGRSALGDPAEAIRVVPGASPSRRTTLAALAAAGLIAGLALGLVRSEFAARAATASIGAALVLLGGLHLPAGLAPGGWIGPTAVEPVLVAWIALSGLGATLQWSYRPRSADIGR